MAGTAERLVFCIFVCCAIIGIIQCPPRRKSQRNQPPAPPENWPTRQRTQGDRTGSFRTERQTGQTMERLRSALSLSAWGRLLSPQRRNPGPGPSTSRRSPPDGGRSRSGSNNSPQRQRSPSQEPPVPPLPYVFAKFVFNDPNKFQFLAMFDEASRRPGDPAMTLDGFKAKKNSLLQTLNDDTCGVDIKAGSGRCLQQLKEFQKIPRKWRGPCKDAYMGVCQQWGDGGWICSFFMKTSEGNEQPVQGYAHTMRDCVESLSPEFWEPR